MPDTFVKIASVTVGSGGASSIDFTSIPSTYTDLVVKYSLRSDRSAISTDILIRFNGSSSNLSGKDLLGNGTTAASYSYTTASYAGQMPAASATATTFGNGEVYIPNYAGSNYKSNSVDAVMENNATSSYAAFEANLWSNTSAITQVSLLPSFNNFVQYSTAVLYGIKSS